MRERGASSAWMASSVEHRLGMRLLRAAKPRRRKGVNMRQRRSLRLKRDELVPPEEDRQLEIAMYDLLLPCRRFDIGYKVAVLGLATPTLEFLLRLIKAVPGISEDDALRFFALSRRELEYVIEEA